jgi:hypothetical protein
MSVLDLPLWNRFWPSPLLAPPEARPKTVPLTARAVFAFDRLVQRFYGVEEFTHHPGCVFRISRHAAGFECVLRDGTRVRPQDHLVEIHFWNERMPRKDRSNPVPWRQRMLDALGFSLSLLAEHVNSLPDGDRIVAAYGIMSLRQPQRFEQLLRPLGVYFENAEARRPLERLVQNIDHVYARLLARAVNPGCTAAAAVSDLQRVQIWVPRSALMKHLKSAPE